MQICKIAARDERCCIGIATALAFALVLGPLDSVRPASDGAASDVNRLISATFFSDACRQRAASLGILSTTDAQFLIPSLAVYVPSLDRYVDPTAPDWQGNAAFDRAVRARAERVHLIGPTPHADPATDPCGGTCMVVYGQAHVSDPVLNDPVRVKTERIHVP